MPVRTAVLALLVLATTSAQADEPQTVRVAASQRYAKSKLHEFFFGGGYRALWETEIELPVLDLSTEGGGLTPTQRFGGLQTAVLGFKSKDGRVFSFRGTDKDPSAILPEVLKATFVRAIVQDQMAAQHPGGPLAAAVLSEGAGVLTIKERLVVLPDDPRLGEFRDDFAGMVGSFFEYPSSKTPKTNGFYGAEEIIGEKKLYERLRQTHDDAVDGKAFLRARLVDILLGDFDRHRKQWRWAKIPDRQGWQPIPEDRDQAFVRYEGGTRIGYIYIPILQNYGADYPSMRGLVLHGWEQDRWLLAGFDWPVWQKIAQDIQERLTDDVIDRAVAALPPEYAAIDGARLGQDIRGRRERMVEGARAFYEHLAAEVDIHTSNAADAVSAQWSPQGTLTVDVRKRTAGETIFSRTFRPSDTHDVRLYLRGGDDFVKITGAPDGAIDLRIISGPGNKVIDDRESGGAAIYDASPATKVLTGASTWVTDESYEPPVARSGFLDVEGIPPRDWGNEWLPLPRLGFGPDAGAILGASFTNTFFGFRRHPWAARYKVSAAFATGALEPLVAFLGQLRPENSSLVYGLDIEYSGIRVLRFYGFGNDTPGDRADSFFRVRNRQLNTDFTIGTEFLSGVGRLSGGVGFHYSSTEDGDRLIDELQPFGAGNFASVGALVRLTLDTRKSSVIGPLSLPIDGNPASGYPTSGLLFDAEARVVPPILDATGVWAELGGSLSAYFSFFDRGRLALSTRVGGRLALGDYPYFAAAFLGGGAMFRGDVSARGLRVNRFAGDASVFGNADLRLYLFKFKLLLPFDFGVHGFGDIGRVFEFDRRSDTWYPSVGGGFWFAPIARTNAISASVAFGDDGPLYYVRLGFSY